MRCSAAALIAQARKTRSLLGQPRLRISGLKITAAEKQPSLSSTL
jgi:hypothetical protein